MKPLENVGFGAFAKSKIAISAPILNLYNRDIPNIKKKKKKKKKTRHPLFFTKFPPFCQPSIFIENLREKVETTTPKRRK